MLNVISNFGIRFLLILGLTAFVLFSEYAINCVIENVFDDESQCKILFLFTNFCIAAFSLLSIIFI